MSRPLIALVFAPFLAWYVFRAGRAIRTGVIDTLGERVTCAEQPERFWPAVGRLVLWSVIVAMAACFAVLGVQGPSLWWALTGYAVIYVGMHVLIALVLRRRT